MNIVYKDENTKMKYENAELLTQLFGIQTSKLYARFKSDVDMAIDFNWLKRVRRGYRIEQLKGNKKGTWSARLGSQYRVEFKWNKDRIENIIIHRVHPHKY